MKKSYYYYYRTEILLCQLIECQNKDFEPIYGLLSFIPRFTFFPHYLTGLLTELLLCILLNISASKPPKNLSATWNEFNNTLLLKWEHPDVTNGPIVAFDLEISCKSKTYSDTIKVNNSRLMYQKMVINFKTHTRVCLKHLIFPFS